MKFRGSLAGLAVSWMSACSDEAPAAVDRNAVLANLADQVMLPTYRDAARRMDALAASMDALCQAPSAERLAAARSAWSDGRGVWKRAQVFQAGPMETLETRPAVDWYPVSATGVEALIAGSSALTVEGMGSVGTNRRGLPGIEVVLYDTARDNDALLAALRDGAGPSRRCQYLVAASGHAARAVRTFVTAWDPAGGGYARALGSAGQGSASFATAREAVDLLVNQVINTLDVLQVSRLSVPNGSRTGGTPDPTSVESVPSNRSVADLSDSLAGLEELYTGSHGTHRGPGLAAMVAERNPTLDRGVRAQLDATARAIAAITVPVQRAVLEQRPQVEASITELGRLKRLFKVDVANALGVTVSFTDNDGD